MSLKFYQHTLVFYLILLLAAGLFLRSALRQGKESAQPLSVFLTGQDKV